MKRGRSGSGSIFARSRRTWTVTVLVSARKARPRPRSSSWSRENAWPGLEAKNSSRSNSRWLSCDLLPVEGDAAGAAVDLERRRSAAARRRPPGGFDAPQDRVDAGDQLARRERLDDVVVGAAPQPGELVLLLALRGQQDHRRRAALALAQVAQDLEAVEPRQHQVEDDEVGALLASASRIASSPSAAVAVS